MSENDSIEVFYLMTSSQMEPDTSRSVYTNSTLKDTAGQTGSDSLLSQINSSEVVLRGDKRIWIPDLSNPQNLSVEITIRAMGGAVNGIAFSDYLPSGAIITGMNVTYYNQTSGDAFQLENESDYYVTDPEQDTLPDGAYIDLYYYNFSFNFTNWSGYLYDNDSITLTYNVTVLGGGEWILPTIISGYDPEYQKNIKTEMYADTNVPSFDVVLEMLTHSVRPGDMVKALLRILNVGGPRAKVDVFVTYSAKTMQGQTIADRSETLAVVEQKEKSLELPLPEKTQPGTYVFESYVTYTGREALSTGTFTVEAEPTKGPLEEYGMYMALVAIIMVLLFMYMRTARKKGSARPGFVLALVLAIAIFAVLAKGQSVTCSLSVLDANPQQGDEVRALLSLSNLNFTGQKTPVLVNYHISDPSGEVVKAESGTFQITDARDIVLKVLVPEESRSGAYSFKAELNSQICSDTFLVGKPDNSNILYMTTAAVVALVAAVFLISRRKR